jgi:NADPH2:quinone reductase
MRGLDVRLRRPDAEGSGVFRCEGLGAGRREKLGGNVLRKSIEVARPRGVVVAYGFAAGPEVTFDIRCLFFAEKQLRGTMASDMEDLIWGLEQVRAGRIKPLLDHTLPLSQAAEAHRLIATNQVTGNLVLLPWVE